ncbi:class IV adenylate cyclase [Saccharomonospora iraqiensis]|uniref:class IV adenylate cyclase n=1 Tax=Saccharomonospora iraqiensis TaxID=52698 RepID=UPI00041B7559|nr:class IV adenylate cyclase [Saccharomonospora iraqiensis]
MTHRNVEFKARCPDADRVLSRLSELGARSQGVDAQEDVYYRVPHGRLKRRRGTIENNLIHYLRPDGDTPTESEVRMHPLAAERGLDELLDAALTRDVVVRKRRHILWIDNVKFHVDEVEGLGPFVEVEAVDYDGDLGAAHLHTQCAEYLRLLGVADTDLEARSYSDLLRGDLSGGDGPGAG